MKSEYLSPENDCLETIEIVDPGNDPTFFQPC
jgi:hypothetical protein